MQKPVTRDLSSGAEKDTLVQIGVSVSQVVFRKLNGASIAVQFGEGEAVDVLNDGDSWEFACGFSEGVYLSYAAQALDVEILVIYGGARYTRQA